MTEGNKLDYGEASKYRQLAASVNDLAMDRLDVQLAASVHGRAMNRTAVQSMAALEGTRYLLRRCSSKLASANRRFDCAGCRTTRRSVSGSIATLAQCALKSWSNRQGSSALSSGEAEYYASVKAVAEPIGLPSLA